jgi:membrane protein implicated in regulation of membrane protease activity
MAAAVVWLSQYNAAVVVDVATLSDFAPFALFLLVILVGVTSMVVARAWARMRRRERDDSPAPRRP